MPTYPHIEQYREHLQELIQFGGSDNEQSIRRAFENCLDAYCLEHREKLRLVAELKTSPSNKPDGTVKDSLRMARGYWEAKDSHDDLDTEIQKKLNRGYPRNNIIFEDSQTAVLFQNGHETMRVEMAQPGDLHRLIRSFLDYKLPEIEEFRQAREQFQADLPAVLENLRGVVAEAERVNAEYQGAAAGFLELCRRSIGPAVSEADVREMLLQHILTQDIFLRVFDEDQFHRENNIARQLDALENTFFTGDVRRDAIDYLKSYYGAIGRAADDIADYAEKQQFLKAIYEDFYKTYNPAAADRLGVVYTPNEVVDFIIRGADHLLQKHFGRGLADNNVQILDPATGTGTFVTSLIDYLPEDRLEYKYLNEIHANEVAILPYYIANLNIEYSYKERTGRYLEFPNLCFVDTLDNMDWQEAGATGGSVTRQGSFNLGGLSEENWIRVQEQNEKPISSIIGNPPYNSNQQNENDNNKNRQYPGIDKRIRDTYIASSAAQKTKQYDMYKRFIRWASDRLADDGIIAFITNRAYLDTRQDDGFRKTASKEFTDIYVLDLGSDVRRNPKISGTTHNVFGIQTGVAIGFFVRERAKMGQCGIHYARREDAEVAKDKLAYLSGARVDSLGTKDIVPDIRNEWLNQSTSDFECLIAVAARSNRISERIGGIHGLFGLTALGVNTARDEWVYGLSTRDVRARVLHFVDTYNALLDEADTSYPPIIKWSESTRNYFERGSSIVYNEGLLVPSLYRPFVNRLYFAEPVLSDRLTKNHYQMFGADLVQDNRAINFCVNGRFFYALAANRLADWHFTGDTQSLPLYRYTPEGERVSNITEWGLRQFLEHYGDGSISAEDIFAYTYAVFHDPVYREKYAIDLLREFPRLPFYDDFGLWATMGQELLDLHVGFESVEPYGLRRVDQGGTPTRVILRPDKEQGYIFLDDKTSLTGVPTDAWRYRLGSRSALEWVLDQYKERKPRDPTIAEKFNTYRFADHKEQVIDLLQRVCTVSVRTMEVVDQMATLQDDRLPSVGN